MPNSANRSDNGKSGIEQPKERATKVSAPDEQSGNRQGGNASKGSQSSTGGSPAKESSKPGGSSKG